LTNYTYHYNKDNCLFLCLNDYNTKFNMFLFQYHGDMHRENSDHIRFFRAPMFHHKTKWVIGGFEAVELRHN